MALTAEEYYKKHGYQAWIEPDWSQLSATDRDIIKDQRPFYQGPSGKEEALMEDIWGRINKGSGVTPDFNLWRQLSEVMGFDPKAIRDFTLKKLGPLFEKPDFGKEYGLAAKDLERNWAKGAAGRGLLDSSGAQAALGGGLSELMLGKASMEESAYMNRLGLGTGLMTGATQMAQKQGFNKANFLNAQWLQDIGLRSEALKYLTGERGNENQFNLQRYAINPNLNNPLTGADVIPGALELATQLFLGTQGGSPVNFGNLTNSVADGNTGENPQAAGDIGSDYKQQSGLLDQDWWNNTYSGGNFGY